MASMHRIWGIDELVLCIFELCDLSSAAVLARASRRMFWIGVPVIWTSPSVSALTALLDFTPENDLPFARSIPENHPPVARGPILQRLVFYAQYVTDLVLVDPYKGGPVLDDFISALGSATVASILPKLQFLMIIAHTSDFAQLSLQFASPRLTWITVFLAPPEIDTTLESGYNVFIPHLSALPRLDVLTLYGNDTTSSVEHVFISSVLQRFPTLHSFDAWRMQVDDTFFHALAGTTSLMTLRILLGPVAAQNNLETISLPALEMLTVEYAELSDVQCLLSRLKSPHLLFIQLDHHEDPIGPLTGPASTSDLACKAYQLITQTIASSWSNTLEVFIIARLGGVRIPASAPASWPFDTFRPLLACLRMRKFSISLPVKINILDSDLVEMSERWQRLSEFLLLTPRSSSIKPNASIRGLIALVSACQKLEIVELSANLQNAVEFLHISEGGTANDMPLKSNPTLRELAVYDCPPCEINETARLLRLLVPGLRKFKFDRELYTFWNSRDPALEDERVRSMNAIREKLGLADD